MGCGINREKYLVCLLLVLFTLVFWGLENANAAKIEPVNDIQRNSMMRKKIFKKVFETPFIDTHEHLMDEKERLSGKHEFILVDDWSTLFYHYTQSDLISSGMPIEIFCEFFSPKVDPDKKWDFLKPYWPRIRNTGYGQAIRITIKELYGIDDLTEKTVKTLQDSYVKARQPGLYKRVLDMANIESCQVDYILVPFKESSMPDRLMQDIDITKMFEGPDFDKVGKPTGIKVQSLEDWHKVIDWWFEKYGKYAVAAKSSNAYSREIDYQRVSADKVNDIFIKKLQDQPLSPAEKKALEDHLFWYAVDKAADCNLPVKIHTGYYALHNQLPLKRISQNPAHAEEMCQAAKKNTKFIFMHIGYPYYEEMIALAKNNEKAYIDMCWSWIINPIAAKDFLKKYLVSAPSNKILTFGGDYSYVELVLGHSMLARRGIALALSELVEEGWLDIDEAMVLVDVIMHQNARNIFNLDKKQELLKTVPWK